jgi:hypothetical protein
MAALHGKNGSIYIDGSKVTYKTEWSLNLTRDYADVTTFRDGNKVYASGLRDCAGTFAGLLDTAGDLTLSKADGTAYTVKLYADDLTTLVAEGPAYLDASVTASATDAVRVTGNFRASGTWTVY